LAASIWRTPRSWVEASYPNVVYLNEVDKGGHFAAWEEPELVSKEMRVAFKSLREIRRSASSLAGADRHSAPPYRGDAVAHHRAPPGRLAGHPARVLQELARYWAADWAEDCDFGRLQYRDPDTTHRI
jgi:hypothetical protein